MTHRHYKGAGRWMQHSARWPPTFGPSWLAWAAIGC